MKYVIIGKGFIGSRLFDAVNASSKHKAYMSTVDATHYVALKEEIEREQPDVVVNAAGITGRPNIDWCEDHKMETMLGNVLLPLTAARICDELGIYFVHYSTGCIYTDDGTGRVFTEKDEPNFTESFYSFSKYHAEKLLLPFNPLILRLRMPFDTIPSERNYVNKLSSFKKVIDIPNSVTIVPELIDNTIKMIEDGRRGIYNMTNPEPLTYPKLFELYTELIDPDFTYETMTVEELRAMQKTARSNCVLDSSKRESQGYHMTPIMDGLRQLLEEYKKHL